MEVDLDFKRGAAERAEALFRAGRFDEAARLYDELMQSGFDGYGQRVNYAQCLKRLGHWHQAIEQFATAFDLHRRGKPTNTRVKLSAFHVRHLIEQLQYISATGQKLDISEAEERGLERLHRFLNDFYGINGEGPVSSQLIEPLARLVLGCANYAPQLDATVRINPAARIQRIDLGVDGSPMFVVDDFLDSDTLGAMRRFLLESTIWFDARPQRGYLGAYLHDGLACELVEKTAGSVLDFATRLIGPGIISQVWAFKYAPSAAGIDLHADQANWNVNMWLTDEAFNRNPSSGGMTIHGCRAPDEWQFEMYNASPDRVRAFLAASNAPSKKIDYRGNRAIIFDSRLFHKTDPVEFSREYQGRRINMTIMIDKRS